MTPDLFGDVSTVDTGERSDFDFYETPAWMTRSLLHYQPEIACSSVLECCSGRDAIANVLRAAGCRVYTNDIDRRHPAMTHGDATTRAYWAGLAPVVDWIVTNTPFNVGFPILVHAFAHARIGVALLLRKTFLEPTEERGTWLAANPPLRIIGQPRHPFRGSGSDSVACDWMIWRRARAPIAGEPAIVIDHVARTRTVR
jgi:hypothetical protein